MLAILLILAFVAGFARRALVGWDAPLWLDEAFTGAIAVQPSFSGLVRDCLNELGGPVYYGFIWAWEKLLGPSNLSLRLPSFIFSVLTPLLVLWRGHPDQKVRLFWAAMIALWVPSFYFSTEARPYALLFLLATGQTILFRRLLDVPSLGRACAWAGLSVLLILTHYHALVLAALQGFAFLVLKRRTAIAAWPASLIFVPMLVWMAFHLPVHMRFSDPQIAWQKVLPPSSVQAFPDLMLGAGRLSLVIFGLIAVTTLLDIFKAVTAKMAPPYQRNDMVAVALGVASILIVYGMGFVRPSFTPRYLVPFMPAVLMGLAMWLRHWTGRTQLIAWLAFLPLLFVTATELSDRLRDPKLDRRWDFSWQQAAEDIRASGAKRLIFLWDNPTTALGYPELLQRTGGFFFERAGVPIPTGALILAGRGDVDPNLVLARLARSDDAIIWAYDSAVPRTLALRHPPRLSLIDRRWKCKNHGRLNITVLSCIRSRGSDVQRRTSMSGSR